MLKYTLVLAAASVTIANGENLSLNDVMEVRDTCQGAFEDLKTAMDSIKALKGKPNCYDLYDTCQRDHQGCSWDADMRRSCPKTCGDCDPTADDVFNALGDTASVEESAKECIDLLKEKCGSLDDYESILGIDVAALKASYEALVAPFGVDVSGTVDLAELQSRAGCGVEEGALGSGTGAGEEEEEASLPIPLIAGIAGGVLALGAIAGGVYYFMSKNDDAENTAAGIADDRV